MFSRNRLVAILATSFISTGFVEDSLDITHSSYFVVTFLNGYIFVSKTDIASWRDISVCHFILRSSGVGDLSAPRM